MFGVKSNSSSSSNSSSQRNNDNNNDESDEKDCDTNAISVVVSETANINGVARNDNTNTVAEQTATTTTNIQSLEIDDLSLHEDELEGANTYDTDDDDDLESLLGEDGTNGVSAGSHAGGGGIQQYKSKRKSKAKKSGIGAALGSNCCCCALPPIQPEKIGNMTIFLPNTYHRTGWGIMGPHWFGPPCVVGIIVFATFLMVRESLHRVGPLSAAICIGFALQSTYYLVLTSYGDPGVVPQSQQQQQHTSGEDLLESRLPRGSRWCDICQTYQPPDGAHCPDCNVCVAGFDHHCVWMGTCIGKYNIKPFLRFNLSWLVYLLYAILWVTILGPPTVRGVSHLNHRNKGEDLTVAQHIFGNDGIDNDLTTIPSAGGSDGELDDSNSTTTDMTNNFTLF